MRLCYTYGLIYTHFTRVLYLNTEILQLSFQSFLCRALCIDNLISLIAWSAIKYGDIYTTLTWKRMRHIRPTLCWLISARNSPLSVYVYAHSRSISLCVRVSALCYTQFNAKNVTTCVTAWKRWRKGRRRPFLAIPTQPVPFFFFFTRAIGAFCYIRRGPAVILYFPRCI